MAGRVPAAVFDVLVSGVIDFARGLFDCVVEVESCQKEECLFWWSHAIDQETRSSRWTANRANADAAAGDEHCFVRTVCSGVCGEAVLYRLHVAISSSAAGGEMLKNHLCLF